MRHMWICLVLGVSATAMNQQPIPNVSQDEGVMLAAVSRDSTTLSAGLSSSTWTGRGTVYVEPIARITSSGQWQDTPCDYTYRASCKKFAREYLNKPHSYTVVSANGQGATIHSAPVKLSECEYYTGTGTYTGASISKSAIAADSAEIFANGVAPRLLSSEEAAPIKKALSALVPGKLDSSLHLHVYSLRFEDKDLVVLQWTTADFVDRPQERSVKRIFAIGSMDEGHYRLLQWKKNTEDEDEQILATIRLKSGREFLITTVTDPESQKFRVYGIRNDKLVVVYVGGGSSC